MNVSGSVDIVRTIGLNYLRLLGTEDFLKEVTAPIDLYIKVTVYGVGRWPSAETKYLSENSRKTKYLRKI